MMINLGWKRLTLSKGRRMGIAQRLTRTSQECESHAGLFLLEDPSLDVGPPHGLVGQKVTRRYWNRGLEIRMGIVDNIVFTRDSGYREHEG